MGQADGTNGNKIDIFMKRCNEFKDIQKNIEAIPINTLIANQEQRKLFNNLYSKLNANHKNIHDLHSTIFDNINYYTKQKSIQIKTFKEFKEYINKLTAEDIESMPSYIKEYVNTVENENNIDKYDTIYHDAIIYTKIVETHYRTVQAMINNTHEPPKPTRFKPTRFKPTPRFKPTRFKPTI